MKALFSRSHCHHERICIMSKNLTGKEKIRQRMIETTARILREKGFKAATVRVIAQEAGVNIASIKYYFGSKEELIGYALDYMMGNSKISLLIWMIHGLRPKNVLPSIFWPISSWRENTRLSFIPFPILPLRRARIPISLPYAPAQSVLGQGHSKCSGNDPS